MALLNLTNLSFAYSSPALFENVTLNVERGERIGLVGRNGAGKSTLLKIIAGEIVPDDGQIERAADTVVARLEQDVPESADKSVFDVAAIGFADLAESVSRYRRLNQKLQAGETLSHTEQATYDAAAAVLADNEAWDAGDRLEGLLDEMGLPPDAEFRALSAGMKRRVLLSRAMIRQPDILLLDEPTNHLDIESILWLQSYLQRFSGTLIFITHDRVFLQEIANRIVEVDRGRLFDWTCDYQTFLTRRDELLAAEEAAEAQFDRKLAEEEKWIRQGIKARRTRNEGRVRALKKMRAERSERRQKIGTAKMQLQEAEKSGRLVARLENVTHGFDGELLIRNLSTTVMRGDRIGIIGPNGIGKSTLLKILIGELKPNEGSVRLGTNLSVAYFDQLRGQLDPEKNARENIGEGSDELLIGGKKRHVMGYLQDFLFTPDRAHTRVSFLSGGERNRLLLAKLLARPANILILDEPTNDLDAETLELLEETLPQFSGTILLVSHDRAFLNNVVASTIAFEGDGVVCEYDGGYDDWKRQYEARQQQQTQPSSAAPVSRDDSSTDRKTSETAEKLQPAARKLTYREQQELTALPDRIDSLEQRQAEIHAGMADPDFFRKPGAEIAAVQKELEQVTAELETCFARWEELE